MTVYVEEQEASNIYLNGNRINRIYKGSTLVYERYVPYGVSFNGSTELSASISPGSNKMTLSAWVKTNQTGGSLTAILGIGTSSDPFGQDNNNGFYFIGVNSGTFLFAQSAANTFTVAQGWRHVLASFDMSDSSKRLLYVDDVALPMTYTNYSNQNWLNATYYVGGSAGPNRNFNGSVAELYVNWGTYLDISQESVRRKFISPLGEPVYLGDDGSRPTGASPQIYLGGPDADETNWQTNHGAGNNFSVSGTLTADSTPPTVAN